MVIDWNFISATELYYENVRKRLTSSETFIFREEDFADAVISPVYRNSDQPQYFYVAEICSDLNPKSAFPSPELFDTFFEYYTSKYNVKITNLTQPLIDVDHTSARLNLLTPRYVNQKGVALPTSSAEMRRQRRENLQQKQILIPELCAIHPIPASMWRKAVLLPTVLYRLNYLLIAEELRVSIARGAKVGNANLPSSFNFPKLQFYFNDLAETSASVNKNGVIDKKLDGSQSSQSLNLALDTAGISVHEIETSINKEFSNDSCCDTNATKTVSCEQYNSSHVINSVDEAMQINDYLLLNSMHKPSYLFNENVSSVVKNGSPFINLDHDYLANIYTGPSPCTILQTLTMSNANDFFNLERLETIGDSFLKFAITIYLYCTYLGIHEGKLSYLRSKQVSNYNLYKLGRRKGLPERMVPIKFEPSENWLPPGFVIRKEGAFRGLNVQLATAFVDSQDQSSNEISDVDIKENGHDLPDDVNELSQTELQFDSLSVLDSAMVSQQQRFTRELAECTRLEDFEPAKKDHTVMFHIPYNLQTQHSLPDKSIADCVEALIGCYLTTCGQRAALKLMQWLGLRVLIPVENTKTANHCLTKTKDALLAHYEELNANDSSCFDIHSGISNNNSASVCQTEGSSSPLLSVSGLPMPPSPLLSKLNDVQNKLAFHLLGFESFEEKIQYRFRDRSYLLQSFTHASYHYNNITDCYQR